MALTSELVRTVNAYLNQKAATTQRVTSFVNSSWNNLDSYRDADIASFAKRVGPVVDGAQIQIGQMTNGYLAAVESASTGSRVSPLALPNSTFATESLRGITTAEAYTRPGSTIWYGLSEGKPLDMLINKGLSRALDITRTNLQLASTHSARAVLSSKPHVVGYRRVLTGGQTCGLCYVASTQRYHKEDLMPIHPGCTCGVSPIYGHSDPGQVIDSNVDIQDTDSSSRFNQDSFKNGQARTSDLRSQVVVHNHGEIGPVLAVEGQSFTGPDDI